MQSTPKIILGLQNGDEGKGTTTAFLARPDDLVVRFNGGHQAGHSVVKGDHRHIFSSFGSGTLNKAATYWSEYCTFYPKSFYNESLSLFEQNLLPRFYMHPLTMISTPFDIMENREREAQNRHGSTGMGFGETINRNLNSPFKLYAQDLFYDPMLLSKLKQIANYYAVTDSHSLPQIQKFMDYVDLIRSKVIICPLSDIKDDYKNIVFEGAQGIMLDQDHGFFPNVTRSHTTSKNAMQLIKDNYLPEPEIYYVMRSYLTRHGNGYMPFETGAMKFEDLTNTPNEYQGALRFGYHSYDQLKYALQCDQIYSGNAYKNLVITCLDQTEGNVLVDNSKVSIENFLHFMTLYRREPKFKKVYTSRSPKSEEIKQLVLAAA